MPIYKTDLYDTVIERIREKIKKQKIKMGTVLSEVQILSFEQKYHIVLPKAYRIFLKEIGDGCDSMIDGFKLNKLNESNPNEDICKPFSFNEPCLWEEEEDINKAEELAEKYHYGQIELIDIGCCQKFNLILNGNCNGEVWFITDVGAMPCYERQDFLGWFELWLDELDNVDYFKDYQYIQ